MLRRRAAYFINFSTLENVIYISWHGEKKTLAQHERLQIVRTAEEKPRQIVGSGCTLYRL